MTQSYDSKMTPKDFKHLWHCFYALIRDKSWLDRHDIFEMTALCSAAFSPGSLVMADQVRNMVYRVMMEDWRRPERA